MALQQSSMGPCAALQGTSWGQASTSRCPWSHTCRCAKPARPGDVVLGAFWGVSGAHHPNVTLGEVSLGDLGTPALKSPTLLPLADKDLGFQIRLASPSPTFYHCRISHAVLACCAHWFIMTQRPSKSLESDRRA